MMNNGTIRLRSYRSTLFRRFVWTAVMIGIGVCTWVNIRTSLNQPNPISTVQIHGKLPLDATKHGKTNAVGTASQPTEDNTQTRNEQQIIQTKIVGFSDQNYKEYAWTWYQRLEALGYNQHVIVAVDDTTVEYIIQQHKHQEQYDHYSNSKWNHSSTTNTAAPIQRQHPPAPRPLRLERLPYPPCAKLPLDKNQPYDSRLYRRQLFARRWLYIYQNLIGSFTSTAFPLDNSSSSNPSSSPYHILITDVDNVFVTFQQMEDFEKSKYDVFHAFSTSYPYDVFQEMGFTVCGGFSWLRSIPSVARFVKSLLSKCNCIIPSSTTNITGLELDFCNETAIQLAKHKKKEVCHCDDQVVLNELLWKGRHKVLWDRTITPLPPKSRDLIDLQWNSITGISSATKHRIQIWDRNMAYRGPLPTNSSSCPKNVWVAMPGYVDRDQVTIAWDRVCGKNNSKTNNYT